LASGNAEGTEQAASFGNGTMGDEQEMKRKSHGDLIEQSRRASDEKKRRPDFAIEISKFEAESE
jgi:hypothetical protein